MRILVVMLITGLSAAAALAVSSDAISRPSEDVTLSFVQAGKVAKVLVKEGFAVEAGQILIQLDDDAEKELLGQMQAEAENQVRVDAAAAQLEQKRCDLEKTRLAAEKEAATAMELENARLEVKIGELSLSLAKFEVTQAKRKYDEARIRVDRMAMRTPITGKVERIIIKEGEGADALAKVVRVVKIDPLWMDVPVPLAQASKISLGDSMQVEFPDHGSTESAVGKVIFKGAVADAASDTLLVRVEVPNPNQRPAGERVKVNVSDVIAAEPPATQPSVVAANASVSEAATQPSTVAPLQ